jgi:hypothetical protein
MRFTVPVGLPLTLASTLESVTVALAQSDVDINSEVLCIES